MPPTSGHDLPGLHRLRAITCLRHALIRTLLALPCLTGCGGNDKKPPSQVLHETPADEIMRVGTRWRSTTEDKGFQSAPSPISLFRHRVQSTVVLGNDQRSATETLRIEEAFEMRDGRRYRCVAQAQIPLALRYGRKQGEAAVELGRPALELTRHCNPPGFPELELTMPATAARFVMRADQLIAVEPPLEKRVYLPTP